MNLPPLSPVEHAHSMAVRTRIEALLDERGGWLPFSEFQRVVLYEPGLGYYSAGAHKLGAGGDFTTAPEISALFSRAVARQIARDLRALAAPAEVLELGAGSGAMAEAMLEFWREQAITPTRYAILEPSADLRARQQQRLSAASTLPAAAKSAAVPLVWLERLPAALTGVIVANELLDALPCERFVIKQGRPQALGVVRDAEGIWGWRARDVLADTDSSSNAQSLAEEYTRLARQLQPLPATLPEGYCGEFMPSLPGLINSLAALLTRGAIVLIDYGLPRAQLYHPERGMGSLQCFRRHYRHDDPLLEPGLTDITAWVDFSAVAEAATAAGLTVQTFCTQTAWLIDADFESDLQLALAAAQNTATRVAVSQAARRLLMPGEMGEAVKVLVLTRNLQPSSERPALQDLRGSL
jgi:SAM-dependent MidA family methyltransferase